MEFFIYEKKESSKIDFGLTNDNSSKQQITSSNDK